MSATERRNDLLAQLLDLISMSLAFRSIDELEALVQAMAVGQSMPLGAMQPNSGAGLIHIDANTSKEDAVAAVLKVAEWVEQHWEELKIRAQETAPLAEKREDLLN